MMVPYHMVPNTDLSNVSGFEECGVYALYPHIYYQNRATNFLTNDQLIRFFDFLLKSITNSDFYNSTYLQHLPLSARHTKHVSYVKFRETGLSFNEGIGRQQSLHYFLLPNDLADVSFRLAAAIEDSGNFDLADFVFLLSSKNLKTMFRSSKPRHLFAQFQSWCLTVINLEHMSPSFTWIDLAKEMVHAAKVYDTRPDMALFDKEYDGDEEDTEDEDNTHSQ